MYPMLKLSAVALLLAATGCSTLSSLTTSNAPSDTVFTASAALNQAEVVAKAYAQSPVADPAIVAKIKKADQDAFNVVDPLEKAALANPSSVAATDAALAQQAVASLTTILASNGIK